ncbi:SpoIIE family protein phosphatase [Streptomyces sp. PHES57]|uniref:SpoIIE family protein phosphatase n=1 Tax=Streptomyces TaxID=1883 RepID=UPI001CEDBC62|nr:SpoIIE family protein phosphatase [Streptomyces sp. PHES57]
MRGLFRRRSARREHPRRVPPASAQSSGPSSSEQRSPARSPSGPSSEQTTDESPAEQAASEQAADQRSSGPSVPGASGTGSEQSEASSAASSGASGTAERTAPLREPSRFPFGARSVAGEVFILQVAVIVLLTAAVVVAFVLHARWDSEQQARNKSLAVAQTFAQAPGVLDALDSRDPTAALQPRAQAVRKAADVSYVVVWTPEGKRITAPKRRMIGQTVVKPFKFIVERAREGRPTTHTIDAVTGGDTVNTAVPVTRPDGSLAGLVSAGVTVSRVNQGVKDQLPVLLMSAAGALVLASVSSALVSRRLRRQTHGLGPVQMTRMYEHHDAVLHSVREGVLILDAEGRLVLANSEARRLLELPPEAEGEQVGRLGLDAGMAELLTSGRTASDEVHLAGGRLLAVNVRATRGEEGPPGRVATLRDTTDLRALEGRAAVSRERLRLLYEAGVRVGTTLDVVRTAEELAEVVVPGFADFATVELLDPVPRGEEPSGARTDMRRVAMSGIREEPPLYPVDTVIRTVATSPDEAARETGHPVLVPDLRQAHDWLAENPERGRATLDYGIRSLISVPLRARGVVLGSVDFWRTEESEPYAEDDLVFAEELAARAAVSVDNARRYTRENAMAVTLQRSLLPRGLPEQDALEVASRYLPTRAGVGGDWFDVIPLPGARVALVVGDVVGHGLHAAATMGRLRTAVLNFSSLDLAPEDLLAHLDELVDRIDQDQTAAGNGEAVTGATCLYAIYDSASGRCTVARAGHLGPAVVNPDGTVDFPEVPVGLPLGLGGAPFETAELQLAEGSSLVLYTDGLVEDRDRDIDDGLAQLHDALADHPGRPPEETCGAVLDALLPADPSDDVALLVARTRVLPADRVAQWDVPADSGAVAPLRAQVTSKLTEWGLEEVAFTTELILSELVTNAIRYGSEPIRARLLYERSLTCEVSDGNSTSPHLRRAAATEEGGRGLFLVAQLAERWGTRYTPHGKVMWTEQSLHGGGTPQEEDEESLLDQWGDGDM